MLPARQFELLNRIAALHHRSLPTYLTYARPWVSSGSESKAVIIDDIAADHHDLVQRTLRVLEADDRPVALGDFPMEYTDLNDLSLDFILQELTHYERRLLKTLEEIASWMDREQSSYFLVNMAIGMAMGHLENLAETKGGSPAVKA
ncbi:hypothetical protein C5Y96_14635 [Blastopirellula marina]|uniref:Uncharacterized protein n=1 Tax=Blastopirellula marina TaxID=124 RepID=A0A2S8FFJ5_9BACT|nr:MULTISPECIES: hypothetical protein [Pirellulaceae]PQO30694.1 hypothetical protein C5Y96_14635 [Blastopirellula marina]RCS50831.1 hypothetical protein DTL36_14645 [Bremerella cremea]